MKLEIFDDVCKSIEKNKDRHFHLLLGNGFSMAYDPDIFSYNALHEFITKLDDNLLKKLFKAIKTKNFEMIMRQLDDCRTIRCHDVPDPVPYPVDGLQVMVKGVVHIPHEGSGRAVSHEHRQPRGTSSWGEVTVRHSTCTPPSGRS